MSCCKVTVFVMLLVGVWTMPAKDNCNDDQKTENDLLRDSREAIIIFKSMMMTHLSSYRPPNEKATIYNIVKNINKLVSQQNSLEEEIFSQGDNATAEIEAVNAVLKTTIETTCIWLRAVINDETFTCSTDELRVLKIKLDTETSVSLLDELLKTVNPDLDGFYPCEFLQDIIKCDDSISISQDIKEAILNFELC